MSTNTKYERAKPGPLPIKFWVISALFAGVIILLLIGRNKGWF